MNAQDVLARTKTCLGRRVAYELGKGGMDPAAEFPFVTPESGCDCSGFAMWALGLPREVDGVWYGTDQIVADATGAGLLFAAVEVKLARVGDLFIYAHLKPGHHGHVGIITSIGPDGPNRVTHCSMGNFRATGDAIQESGAQLWTMVQTSIIARCKALTEAPVT